MSQLSYEQLKTDVKHLILKVSGLSQMQAADIDDRMPLFGDGLGLDSIDVLELVVALDKNYGIKIRNDDDGKKILSNVESIAKALAAHSASAARTQPC